VNTDHDVVYRTVMVASKPSYSFVKEIYAYEIPSSTNWAFPSKSNWFEPHMYVDITNFIQKKLEILSLFDDQIFEFPHARSIRAVEALAAFRGSSVGVKYAEAFKVLRIVR
jgi:LmbE family N-acetylglucosaminyl deacetylase